MIAIHAKFSGGSARKLHATAAALRAAPRKMTMAGARLIRTNIGREIDDWAENPTGKLARSFDVTIADKAKSGEVNTSEASITSTLPYAGIHETGGTIRPRRARALTVPLNAFARKVPARAMGGRLFKLKGTNILAMRVGGRVVRMFALRESVYIRPKRYIQKALARSRPALKNLLGATVRASIKREAVK